MAKGLHVRVRDPRRAQPAEWRFARLPVMIGRDPDAVACVLPDGEVSKLHASVDVRDGVLFVRDAGSTNGTYVDGQRLPANQWVAARAGPAHAVAVQIADYLLQISVEDQGVAPAAPTASLADAVRVAVPARVTALARLGPLHDRLLAASKAFYEALAADLETLPAAARAQRCEDVAKAFPLVTADAGIAALLRAHGGSRADARPASSPPIGVSPIGASPVAVAALRALTDLAARYLGAERSLSTPGDVVAFSENLRSAFDELLLGFLPLRAAVSRFEEQMAITSGSAPPLPSAPADLARALLEWHAPTTAILQKLRSTFAELAMHQVAVLNGVMRGVKALLSELSPGVIEETTRRQDEGRGAFDRVLGRSSPWTAYKVRYADLADEENERFRLLFGPEFVEEYRQFLRGGKGVPR